MTGSTTSRAAVALGERYVFALAGKDERGLRDVLAAEVRFRGLTPGRVWEADGPDAAIDILFGSWFEQSDRIEQLVSHDVRDVVDKVAIRYRLNVRNADGLFLVEQQGYLDVSDEGRISDVAIVCSGFRPIPAAG